MIDIRRVSRRYREQIAVADVSLTIRPGESVAILGHNGAGKSTLLRMVAGLTRPTTGEVTLDGRSPRDPARRGRLGLLAHESFLYDALTARENLRLVGALYGLREVESRIDDVLDQVGIAWAADLPVGGYSRGMAQRAALARVLLPDPDVLLLDEPFAGLDHAADRFLRDHIRRLRDRGKTLLMVTHDPNSACELAGRAVILRRGTIASDRPIGPDDAREFATHYVAILTEGQS